MKKEELLRMIVRNYFIIFSIVVLGMAALNYDHLFSVPEIFLCAAFSLAGDLPSLVYYSKGELSAKSRRIRQILHFVLIEIVILTFGNVTGQVHGIVQTVLFGLEILGIYTLVSLITWRMDSSAVKDINEELEKMHRNNAEDEEL